MTIVNWDVKQQQQQKKKKKKKNTLIWTVWIYYIQVYRVMCQKDTYRMTNDKVLCLLYPYPVYCGWVGWEKDPLSQLYNEDIMPFWWKWGEKFYIQEVSKSVLGRLVYSG